MNSVILLQQFASEIDAWAESSVCYYKGSVILQYELIRGKKRITLEYYTHDGSFYTTFYDNENLSMNERLSHLRKWFESSQQSVCNL